LGSHVIIESLQTAVLDEIFATILPNLVVLG